MTTYNINELLERKKDLENQIAEKRKINPEELKYAKETYTDHTNATNTKVYEARPRVTLDEYARIMQSLTEELSKVKTAIQKYNAEKVLDLIHEREAARTKIAYFKDVKANLLRDTQHGRRVTRQNKDGETLESADVLVEPMFKVEEVQKRIDQLAAQERKLNTAIQKQNLDASIEVS